MKSMPNVSSIADLVRRASRAAIAAPRVKDGMMNAFHDSAPNAGSHRNVTEKRRMSMMPTQKFGIAAPMVANDVLSRSSGLLRLTAESTPSGIAIASATTADT